MWNSLKTLYKDFSNKVDPNGIVSVSFKEPEYPYYFEFNPKNLSTVQRLKLEGLSNYGNGRMLIKTNKSGKPIIVDAFVTAKSESDEINLEVIRNDLNIPIEILEGFARLCISRGKAKKAEDHSVSIEKDTANVRWTFYEWERQRMKELWNKHMKPKIGE